MRLKQHREAEESAVLEWVEEHIPAAELQQQSPGSLSFSIAQEVNISKLIIALTFAIILAELFSKCLCLHEGW